VKTPERVYLNITDVKPGGVGKLRKFLPKAVLDTVVIDYHL
jgi:hypothetical protein